MKVGILSDIHGNHFALLKVLEEATKLGVEKLLVLGDVVGYYYHPDRVLDLLNKFPFEIIKGNHEQILQDIQENRIDPEIIRKKYGRGHEFALEKLDDKTRNWLYALPYQKSIQLDEVFFQMNHGSPWNYDEYLYPDTNSEILDKCDSNIHDFVLIGHSHYSFSYACKSSILINSGSVGQSRLKGGYAEWSIINTENKEYQLIQTPYDPSELIQEVYKIDPEIEYNSKILTR